jgi:hypothetical protein
MMIDRVAALRLPPMSDHAKDAELRHHLTAFERQLGSDMDSQLKTGPFSQLFSNRCTGRRRRLRLFIRPDTVR